MYSIVNRRWDFCIVAAPGPSLTDAVARACDGYPVIAVNDAWRRIPSAEILYACGSDWWNIHDGCPEFAGEKWSSHGDALRDDKREAAKKYGLNIVRGVDEPGYSLNPAIIHYGDNGGFQALNLAIHAIGQRGRIALVGFDMRMVEGERHFFGDHPKELTQTRPETYARWARKFEEALLPDGLEIINCTPGSGIKCFPFADLSEVLPPRGYQ